MHKRKIPEDTVREERFKSQSIWEDHCITLNILPSGFASRDSRIVNENGNFSSFENIEEISFGALLDDELSRRTSLLRHSSIDISSLVNVQTDEEEGILSRLL